MTDKEILTLIENRARGGVTIQLYRNSTGGPYWCVRDLVINAGGYLSMREAIYAWADTIEYLEKEKK